MTIEYMVPDERKVGGVYVTITGRVRHVSMVMESGAVILLDNIVSITSEIF